MRLGPKHEKAHVWQPVKFVDYARDEEELLLVVCLACSKYDEVTLRRAG